MKKLKKILKWILFSIVFIVGSAIVFRNEIVLTAMRAEQSKKSKRPFEVLELPVLSDSLYETLSNDYNQFALSPADYIIHEFQNHDIVFLGENHRIKHDIVFMQELIPILYKNGIHHMGFEFALQRDSLLIREVLTNREFFDQEKANQIIFNLSPFWGFKEYIDLFKAAWQVNKNLPEDAEKFMIHGIMHDFDFSLMQKRSDEFDEEKMTKIRKGIEKPEQFMANAILNDLVKKNMKAIIYCGIHHAFTGYPGHGKRVGVIVKDSIGNRTMTVALHYPWNSKKGLGYKTYYPVNGFLDAFLRKHQSEHYAFGINVNETAFGNLIDTTSVYVKQPELFLKDFCDGYIYLNSFHSAEGATIQKKFINRKNIGYAKTQFPNPELRDGMFKFVGAKVYNELPSMDADIEYQFRHLY